MDIEAGEDKDKIHKETVLELKNQLVMHQQTTERNLSLDRKKEDTQKYFGELNLGFIQLYFYGAT